MLKLQNLLLCMICALLLCAAPSFAAEKKITFDLNKGTAHGSYGNSDVRMAGTFQAPPPVRRQISRYQRNRKYYKTPRGRYQMARNYTRSTNYGGLNQ